MIVSVLYSSFAICLYWTLSQVVDLGSPVHSHATAPGCHPQHTACPSGCGVRGRCVGGLRHPHCECEPGWAGLGCTAPTTPTRFDVASYVKVALSFSPGPWVVRVQLRVRLRGTPTGLLVQLATHHNTAALTLHVRLIDTPPGCVHLISQFSF